MQTLINARDLRGALGEILERVRKGERFTVIYRSRPVCQIVPLDEQPLDQTDLDEDSLYGAQAIGYSKDGKTALDHDEILYGDGD
jgi:prevent-host-death family protein